MFGLTPFHIDSIETQRQNNVFKRLSQVSIKHLTLLEVLQRLDFQLETHLQWLVLHMLEMIMLVYI